MTRIVDVHEARAKLTDLLDKVMAGEDIVIAKDGLPVAKLVALAGAPRRPGLIEGRVTEAFFDPLPPDEQDEWHS